LRLPVKEISSLIMALSSQKKLLPVCLRHCRHLSQPTIRYCNREIKRVVSAARRKNLKTIINPRTGFLQSNIPLDFSNFAKAKQPEICPWL
jgi:hypothetical protein